MPFHRRPQVAVLRGHVLCNENGVTNLGDSRRDKTI